MPYNNYKSLLKQIEMKLKYRHTLPLFLIGRIYLIKITTDCSEFQLPAPLHQLMRRSFSSKGSPLST